MGHVMNMPFTILGFKRTVKYGQMLGVQTVCCFNRIIFINGIADIFDIVRAVSQPFQSHRNSTID